MKKVLSLLCLMPMLAFGQGAKVTGWTSTTNPAAALGALGGVPPLNNYASFQPVMGSDNYRQYSWPHVLAAINGTYPWVVMPIGDSVISGSADMSLPVYFALAKVYGYRGFYGNGGGNIWNVSVTAPAQFVPGDSTNWPMSYSILTNSGIVQWSSIGFNYVTGNVLTVDYIAQAGAGAFNVQTNILGGAWTTVLSIDPDNGGSPVGKVWRMTNSVVAPFQLRVVGTSPNKGPCYIPGGGIIDNTGPGVIFANVVQGGGNIAQFTGVPDAVKGPILADWSPTLIYMEYKDDPEYYRTNLPLFHSFQTNFLTNADFVLFGTTPIQDQNASFTNNFYYSYLQNQVGHSNAVLFGWSYLDFYWPFGGNWTNAFQAGLMASDGIHPSPFGYAAKASIFVHWMGLIETAYQNFASGNYAFGSLTNVNMWSKGPGGNFTPISFGGTGGNLQFVCMIYGFNGTLTLKGANGGLQVNNNIGTIGVMTVSDSGLMGLNAGIGTKQSNKAALNSITVTASPFNWTNTQAYNVTVFVNGGTVSAVAVNGTSVSSGSNIGAGLQPGEWVTVTYTGAPTMVWKAF